MPSRKKTVPSELGQAIKRVRLACGETQQAFAERMHLSVTTVSGFELGRRIPRDRSMLTAFGRVAANANLPKEQKLFQEAAAANARNRMRIAAKEIELLQDTLDNMLQGLVLLKNPDPEIPSEVKAAMLEGLIWKVDQMQKMIAPLVPPAPRVPPIFQPGYFIPARHPEGTPAQQAIVKAYLEGIPTTAFRPKPGPGEVGSPAPVEPPVPRSKTLGSPSELPVKRKRG